MPIPVSGDDLVKAALNGMLTQMGSAVLHLFVNDFSPLPNSLTTDFLEATFPGYASVLIGPLWGPLTNPSPGVWQSDPGVINFNCTSGSQIVYGWWIQRGSHFLEAAQRLDTPISVTAGVQIQLEPRPQGITQFVV